jgi:formylglycine-generating enzyme required for sulfatase activity
MPTSAAPATAPASGGKSNAESTAPVVVAGAATTEAPPAAPANVKRESRNIGAESAARSTEIEAFIPAGTYVLGPYDFCLKLNESTRRLEGKGPDFKHGYIPAKEVALNAYFLDRTEVTVAEFGQCVKAGRCKPISDTKLKEFPTGCSQLNDMHKRLPGGAMNCVNHTEAADYCAWKGKRLPTDAEWETAARGGDGRTFVWGDDFLATEDETFTKLFRWSRPCKVREFGPYGPFKLYGMESGVSEWTSNSACDSDPTECAQGQFGVRGGSYSGSKAPAWAAFGVGGVDGRWRFPTIGFRCARDAE